MIQEVKNQRNLRLSNPRRVVLVNPTRVLGDNQVLLRLLQGHFINIKQTLLLIRIAQHLTIPQLKWGSRFTITNNSNNLSISCSSKWSWAHIITSILIRIRWCLITISSSNSVVSSSNISNTSCRVSLLRCAESRLKCSHLLPQICIIWCHKSFLNRLAGNKAHLHPHHHLALIHKYKTTITVVIMKQVIWLIPIA
jgi:hypothetical protein